ncbi:hypothetical protein DPEC_G00270170 [Dallia pectoralis]|uniref:Uncharacterized protein n=1 Tax=Dallia pectoralis TaxID=75939 RepID=A0ACC2FP64_DALPE|nr:hypothetical protein DPEC_G00270170 [Dallia pectoralis]
MALCHSSLCIKQSWILAPGNAVFPAVWSRSVFLPPTTIKLLASCIARGQAAMDHSKVTPDKAGTTSVALPGTSRSIGAPALAVWDTFLLPGKRAKQRAV